jgi:hypothetical protein
LIHCIFIKHIGGNFAGIQIEGHSPSSLGSKGENLLCAGVSTLVQSVHTFLATKKVLQMEVKQDGVLRFLIRTGEEDRFQELLQMVELGMTNLKTQYPTAISLKTEIIKG